MTRQQIEQASYKSGGVFLYHQSDDYTLIMAENGKGIVSVCLSECVKTCTWIYNLSVEFAHRRKGIGKLLLTEAENQARVLGATSVALSVKSNTWMLDWYLRCNYLSVSSDDEYITMYKSLK